MLNIAVLGNERSVGQAIKESGIPREELFITTKLALGVFLDRKGCIADN